MSVFFGTDGIRGIVNQDLSYDLAFRCGNALASSVKNPTIIIGSDTRTTNSYITLSLAIGAMSLGAKIIDIGIVPTAGIAYITKKMKADYGVVISASHNSAEFNGIKIFDKSGYKLGDKREELLERKFIHTTVNDFPNLGTYTQNFNLIQEYKNLLFSTVRNRLNGLKVVLDCSNGAAYDIAPQIFKRLGAKVVKVCCKNDGLNINNDCGSLYPDKLSKKVVECKADMGFAFDGDSDRLIAVDEKGVILDGDIILFLLANNLKIKGKLKNNIIVGTSHTNMGLEKQLKNNGIDLIRVDVGDKYVIAKMLEDDISLGGEKSGHIILKEYSTTGDGILAALQIASIVSERNVGLSYLTKVDLYPQINLNVNVRDKLKIINSESLSKEITNQKELLGLDSRITIRASGTEPKIRIMVECLNQKYAENSAEIFKQLVEKIDKESI